MNDDDNLSRASLDSSFESSPESVHTTTSSDGGKSISLAKTLKEFIIWCREVRVASDGLKARQCEDYKEIGRLGVMPPRCLPGRAAFIRMHAVEDEAIDQEVLYLIQADIGQVKFVDADTLGIERWWPQLRSLIRRSRALSSSSDENEAFSRMVGDDLIYTVFDVDYPEHVEVRVRPKIQLALHCSRAGPRTVVSDISVLASSSTLDSLSVLNEISFSFNLNNGQIYDEAFVTNEPEITYSRGIMLSMFYGEAKKTGMDEDVSVHQLTLDLSSGQFHRRALGLKEKPLFGAVYAGSKFTIYAATWQDTSTWVRISIQETFNLYKIEDLLTCYIRLVGIRDFATRMIDEDMEKLTNISMVTNIVKSMKDNRWRTSLATKSMQSSGSVSTISSALGNTIEEEDRNDSSQGPRGFSAETQKGGDPSGPSGGGLGPQPKIGNMDSDTDMRPTSSSSAVSDHEGQLSTDVPNTDVTVSESRTTNDSSRGLGRNNLATPAIRTQEDSNVGVVVSGRDGSASNPTPNKKSRRMTLTRALLRPFSKLLE